MEVNWKERYMKLAEYAQKLMEQLRGIAYTEQRIENHIEDSKRLDLSERGKRRYMRLKEDVALYVEYYHGHNVGDIPREYPAGTLIECNESGSVYLDLDGDGHLYFPPELLEPVEVDDFDENIDWNKIVTQG